jgi:hypothetical protein
MIGLKFLKQSHFVEKNKENYFNLAEMADLLMEANSKRTNNKHQEEVQKYFNQISQILISKLEETDILKNITLSLYIKLVGVLKYSSTVLGNSTDQVFINMHMDEVINSDLK